MKRTFNGRPVKRTKKVPASSLLRVYFADTKDGQEPSVLVTEADYLKGVGRERLGADDDTD